MNAYKNISIIFASLLCFMFMNTTKAQDVTFTADAYSTVSVGRSFTLQFTLNANGSKFTPPNLSDFHIISGPSRSSSSNTQIINGKVSQNRSLTYRYILQPKKTGKYTIGSATITTNGKKIKSNPISIEVIKGTANNQQSQSSNNPSRNASNTSQNLEDAAFLRTEVSKSNPMLGEQVIVTYKLYFRVNIADYNMVKKPKYQGSWSEDLTDENSQSRQYTQIIKGKEYHVAEIYREAIFPQKTGKVVSSPMEFDIVMRVRDNSQKRSNDPFESFFNNSFFNTKDIKKRLVANTPNINVKPLPIKGKPHNFSGAVGKFTISSNCDNTEVKVNDAINFTYSIKGTGNIKLVELPEIDFPVDFEVYDPEIKNKINKSLNQGISGTKSFKFVVIPRTAGSFKIPALQFSYFDILSRQYKTLTTEAYTINVEKGEGDASMPMTTVRRGNKRDIQYVGSDIRYIKTHLPDLQKNRNPFFGSTSFILWLIISFIVFILLLFWLYSLDKNRSNVIRTREKKAKKIASKRLKEAEAYLKKNDSTNFYDAVARTLWGYIADKFNIPPSELSIDTIKEKLEKKNVDADLIIDFGSTIEDCEYARFAPGENKEKMKEIYNRSIDVIVKTEKELR